MLQPHCEHVNLNNFHSLEVVDRVSETQFQVGEIYIRNRVYFFSISLNDGYLEVWRHLVCF